MDCSVYAKVYGNHIVVEVAGEVDVYVAGSLRQKLAETIEADVVVDLTAVTFIDSTGIGVLVGALMEARRHGGRMQLVVKQGRVLKAFRRTLLAQVFTIHETLDAALAN